MRWFTRRIATFRRRITSAWRGLIVNPILAVAYWLTPSKLARKASKRVSQTISSTADAVAGHQTAARPRRQWLHFFIGVPAAIASIGVLVLTLLAVGNQRDLGQTYWRRGLSAIQTQDYEAAQLFLTRASGAEGVAERDVDFALAVVFDKLGYAGRSMEIFQRLAPHNRVGFPKAHRHLAILIGQRATVGQNVVQDGDTLARWLWHLTHADSQTSAEVQETWGNYYLAVDDLSSAIQAYNAAASRYPHLYLRVASLQGRLGRFELRTQTLQLSRERYSDRVTDNPGDRDSRIMYATTLMALGELQEAERVLQTGKRLDPDGPYDGLLAAMYVQLHDQLRNRVGNAYGAEAIAQLRNALQLDPNFAPALNRVLSYAQVDESSIDELRSILNEILATGRGTAMAHLALSNLAWLEKNTDQAAFHLDQAIAMDAKMPVIANNLAWLLAHAEKPELERALKLSDATLKDGDNPRYLDTRGTILIKLGRPKDALVDLEKALPKMTDQASMHRKIADVYRELGMEDIAKNHEKMARK